MKWIITGVGPNSQDLAETVGVGQWPKSMVSEGGCVIRHARRLPGLPAEAIEHFCKGYADPMPIEFQLLDDDGEVYLIGRAEHLDGDVSECFAPLDWFMEIYGVTAMQYRDYRPEGEPQQEWKDL
jgi:hypothetical protein